MRAESRMWAKVRPFLVAAKLDPVRVENPIHPGTPDVNLCDGRWIELKCIANWPARATSPVQIRHYTPQQRVWLYRRWRYAPGSTFLLLEVCSVQQWLLFDGNVAAKIVGRGTMAEHQAHARALLTTQELSELPKIFIAAESAARGPELPVKIAPAIQSSDLPVKSANAARGPRPT